MPGRRPQEGQPLLLKVAIFWLPHGLFVVCFRTLCLLFCLRFSSRVLVSVSQIVVTVVRISRMLPLCSSAFRILVWLYLVASWNEAASSAIRAKVMQLPVFSMGLGSTLTAEAVGKGQVKVSGECFSSEGSHLKRSPSGISFYGWEC